MSTDLEKPRISPEEIDDAAQQARRPRQPVPPAQPRPAPDGEDGFFDRNKFVLCGFVFFATLAAGGFAADEHRKERERAVAARPSPLVSQQVAATQWDCCGHLFEDETGMWWLTNDSARRYAKKPANVRGWHLVDSEGRHRWVGEEGCGKPPHYWRLHVDPKAVPVNPDAP